MEIKKEDIMHIAKLSMLNLSEEEILSKEADNIKIWREANEIT